MSIRQREQGGASTIVEGDKCEENVVVEEAHEVEDDEAYLGGPVDRLLLSSFEDHVTRQLRNGVVSNNVNIHALNLMCYLLDSNAQMKFTGCCRIAVN